MRASPSHALEPDLRRSGLGHAQKVSQSHLSLWIRSVAKRGPERRRLADRGRLWCRVGRTPMLVAMYLNTFAGSLAPIDMTTTEEFKSLLDSADDLGIAHSPGVRYVSRQTVIRGLRFHFLEWGALDAPPVLLLHGETSPPLVGSGEPAPRRALSRLRAWTNGATGTPSGHATRTTRSRPAPSTPRSSSPIRASRRRSSSATRWAGT